MTATKRVEGYTPEQLNDAKRLIEILVGVPEDKLAIFTAITTAYIDGVETGARIASELEGATV